MNLTQTLKAKILESLIILESIDKYEARAAGQKRFVMKHFDADNRPTMAPGFEGETDRAGNNLSLYRGVTKVAPRPGHGYAAAPSKEDEAVYEGKTYRHGDNTKHMKRSGVKKYLMRKKRGDEKRLQENTELAEISKKTLGSYINKAVPSYGSKAMQLQKVRMDREDSYNAINGLDLSHGERSKISDTVSKNSNDKEGKLLRKTYNHDKGIKRAVARLQGNPVTPRYGKKPSKPYTAESFDIPENEDILELITDINEASAQQQDVRALRGKIVHRQFVGMIGTAGEQEHYRIMDTAGRTHHIFTNKQLGKKGEKVDLHVAEYKKGGGLLSVAKKNMVKESLNESLSAVVSGKRDFLKRGEKAAAPKDAHETYMEHHHAVKKLLGDIGSAVDNRHARITAPTKGVDYVKGNPAIVMRPGKAHWGHTGDMKSYRRQLEDLRDSLTQQGEYSLPTMQAAIRKEETEVNLQELDIHPNDKGLDLAGVRKKMMDTNRIHQMGVKNKDTVIQGAAKTRLQQLAKLHAQLSRDNVDEEFAPILEQINQIIGE